ncbi:MAG: nucleoside triphosphate pyrophosphohydrolase [Hyphomicrobiaceae bacterium]
MTTKDNKALAPIQQLLDVMEALRTPVTGCPWDLQQDFASIAPYTIEEAYEVSDAIARDDAVELRDELGDLLLQVVYHARIAQERELFDFDDVAEGIVQKMVRRHPHVFGSPKERAAGPQAGSWDRIKKLEKDARRQYIATLPQEKKSLSGQPSSPVSNPDQPPRTLSDIPAALPALTRAIKLQSKAAKVGFDWPSLEPVFDKMREELAELETAHRQGVSQARSQPTKPTPEMLEEFGDLLFVMANVARHMKIDPEDALRHANAKFTRRFEGIEDRLAQLGKTPAQSDLVEMDQLWNAIKVQEKQQT